MHIGIDCPAYGPLCSQRCARARARRPRRQLPECFAGPRNAEDHGQTEGRRARGAARRAAPSTPMHLVYVGGRHMPASTRAFLDFVEPRLARAPRSPPSSPTSNARTAPGLVERPPSGAVHVPRATWKVARAQGQTLEAPAEGVTLISKSEALSSLSVPLGHRATDWRPLPESEPLKGVPSPKPSSAASTVACVS